MKIIRPLLPLLLLAACGGEDPDRAPRDAGASLDAGATGAAKGEACAISADCAEPTAVCRSGNLCTGPIDEVAFQLECTADAPERCPGLVCVGLTENVQAKAGICSLPCNADADCQAGAACVALLPSRSFCLRICETSADCANGFVCVDDPEGRGRACLVEPT